MKVIKRVCILILLFIMFGFCGACSCKPMSFDTYCDYVFRIVMGNSAVNWNLLIDDDLKFGMTEDSLDGIWYSYTKTTPEVQNQRKRAYTIILNKLNNYNYDELSDTQKVAYDCIKMEFANLIKKAGYSEFYELTYIDRNGGYVSSFINALSMMKPEKAKDFEYIMSYLESSRSVFATYITYANDRIVDGFPLSTYTLDGMISFLNDVANEGKDYFLYDKLSSDINNSTFLDDNTKNYYLNQLDTLYTNNFVLGLLNLSEGLTQIRNEYQTNSLYLKEYEDGSQYYEILLESILGIDDIDMDSYLTELNDMATRLTEEMKSVNTMANSTLNSAELELYNNYINNTIEVFQDRTPEEILSFLIEIANQLVPTLESSSSIHFSYASEVENKYATYIAYYTKSKIDDKNSDEAIKLNTYAINSNLELISTLSHEGYPGHLYQNLYNKYKDQDEISYVTSNLGFTEGWAMYVEDCILSLLAESYKDDLSRFYAIIYLRDKLLYGYVMSTWLDGVVNTNRELPENYNHIIERIVNEAGSIASYGYGYVTFKLCHEKCALALGDNYDEVDFNGYLLFHCLSGTDSIKYYTDKYISEKTNI